MQWQLMLGWLGAQPGCYPECLLVVSLRAVGFSQHGSWIPRGIIHRENVQEAMAELQYTFTAVL